ncbi:PREDICTED: E3 ubiquitin ligase BIG BROTHER-related [Tarenaya hassleriana]|uniref:E3 ubiquitin ligase BIG BROTHER-related n=1 Tax=Tarenaya hassleriana TaxID=28532 RepID=UPI00053C5B14|nr:PREDICTED: E3 ubiquitin ligase BIG BROTHER-related [Tarenaya hassleriana]
MSMKNDNTTHNSSAGGEGGGGGITDSDNIVDRTSKMTETDGRLPENRENGDSGVSGDRTGSGGEESEAAAAMAENGSNSVAEQEQPRQAASARVPFTNLSQIDADLALARTLQEQERAYMMLSMNNEVRDYGSWQTGSYLSDEDEFDDPEDDDRDIYEDGDEDDEEDDETDVYVDEDASDVHAHEDGQENYGENSEFDMGAYSDDEAYARALQEAEEREMAARMFSLAGLNDQVEHAEDQDHNPQDDAWEEVDPDELLYEELLALGEVVGTESRGLSADAIASLPSVRYKAGSNENGSNESCVICRLDYEDGDDLILLSCKHSYHPECINNWLKINKVCPVCSAEVSTSGQS